MEIISVVNQKGGVGKTTTCMNLAASLAVINRKVLIIDMDPQGNASTGLGVSNKGRDNNIYNLLLGQSSIEKAIKKTSIKNLYIIPSVVHLAAAELELKELSQREFILKKYLLQISGSYDYILIDCPPSLGLLTINALAASNEVIIPMQCEFFALEGVSHLLKTIQIIKQRINPLLSIKGVLLTMYDKRNRVSKQVAKEIKKHLKDKVFETFIPRNVKISEAPSFGKPVIAYAHNCPGAKAYINLVKEILTQNKLKSA